MTESTAAFMKNNIDDDDDGGGGGDDDDDNDDDFTWSPSRRPASWIGPQRSVELNSHCPPSSGTLE